MVRVIPKLLRLPILYKILVGNVAVVIVGAVVGTGLTQRLADRSGYGLMALFTICGITLSTIINFVIIKTALRPLAHLQGSIHDVFLGDTTVRASAECTGHSDIGPIASALNAMLDALEAKTEAIEVHRRRLRLLSDRAVYTQEDERKRIARELHDETSQELATLIINLEMTEEALLSEQRDIRQQIAAAREIAVSTLEGIRKLVSDLRPAILDDVGLCPAVRWYAKNRLESAGIEVKFQIDCFERVAPEVETPLFRIVQESVNNIARHSGATQVTLRLVCQNPLVTLVIRDNGHGFDVEQVRQSAQEKPSLGLLGIEERVSLLQGTFTIESQPGQGTQLTVALPSLRSIADEQNTCPVG